MATLDAPFVQNLIQQLGIDPRAPDFIDRLRAGDPAANIIRRAAAAESEAQAMFGFGAEEAVRQGIMNPQIVPGIGPTQLPPDQQAVLDQIQQQPLPSGATPGPGSLDFGPRAPAGADTAQPQQQMPAVGGPAATGEEDEFNEFLAFVQQNRPDIFERVQGLLQDPQQAQPRAEPIPVPEVGTDRTITGFRLPEDDLGTPREQIEREFLDRSLRSLRGELPVSPALMRDLQQREELLEERIRRQFGPGGETASPAIEMRRQFEEGRALTLEEARRQDLAMSEQLGTQRQLSRQQALQDFLGNVERVQGFGQQLEQPLTQLTTGQAQIPFTQLGGIQTALQTLGVPGTPQDVSATAALPLQAFAGMRGQEFAGRQQQNQFMQELFGNALGTATFAAGGGFS